MSDSRPRTNLITHEVINQPTPLEDKNLFSDDVILRQYATSAGAQGHVAHLTSFGAKVGSSEVIEAAALANRYGPKLRSHDRWGRRLDEVEYHPTYHQLMSLGLNGGVASRAWTHPDGGHAAHAALLFLMWQADGGVTCPMTMTYAAVAALRADESLTTAWEPLLTSADYDPRALPSDQKRAATMGMAMTEKQGGSDVRANTTSAFPIGSGHFRLVGHKWFCSAPMSDAFLTLAYADGQLSCFVVPKWRSDGERNAIEIQRLKDKLGDRSNASSEIEYHDAEAFLLGEPGRGVRTIVEMVNHTRLDCVVASASAMRQSLSLAIQHVSGRTAFQRRLIDQPLMTQVLADISVEVEAHIALSFRLAQAFDRAGMDSSERALARLLTPVAKYWLTKRSPTVIAEALESLGGAGYIEEGPMARIFRASPLNGIWEGSGNVMALDVLRVIAREPEAVSATVRFLWSARGASARYDAAIDWLATRLATPGPEGEARWLVERLAIAAEAAALFSWGQGSAAEAHLRARSESGGSTFGASQHYGEAKRMVERAAIAA